MFASSNKVSGHYIRGRRSEVRERSEVRGRRSEIRGQRSEIPALGNRTNKGQCYGRRPRTVAPRSLRQSTDAGVEKPTAAVLARGGWILSPADPARPCSRRRDNTVVTSRA